MGDIWGDVTLFQNEWVAVSKIMGSEAFRLKLRGKGLCKASLLAPYSIYDGFERHKVILGRFVEKDGLTWI
ncbi:MAG: hypothetical protein SLagBPW_04000 [Shewanella algae]